MPEPEALAAALLQLSEHTEKLAALDAREAAHTAEIGDRISALTTLANGMKDGLADQAEILAGLHEQVAALAARLDDTEQGNDGEPAAYQPSPSPRFWRLDGQAREDAISRLRAWVEQIYRPGYGHLSAARGGCWEQHPVCLYTLDWLSELWSVLYLTSERTTGNLAGQAEWQTRLLTAAAEQMARETSRCEHAASRNGRPVRTGTLP